MTAAKNSMATMMSIAIIAMIKRTLENGRKRIPVAIGSDGREIDGIENEIIEVDVIMITIDDVSAIEIEIVIEIENENEIETEKEIEIESAEDAIIKAAGIIRKANGNIWIVHMRTNQRILAHIITQAVAIMRNFHHLMAPARLRITNIKCRKFPMKC